MGTNRAVFKAWSSPGKVLLTGGYLVLDRSHDGLVYALNARIHAVVNSLSKDDAQGCQIRVRSPQFIDAEWLYTLAPRPDAKGIQLDQLPDSRHQSSRNVFIETALMFALTYAFTENSSASFNSANVTILADSNYYSHSPLASAEPQSSRTQFHAFGVRLSEAHKTGLGSSAALVTALIAAIISAYVHPDKLDLESERGKTVLHRVAQAAHCSAQGKVGSGFDVAAAVYGSCSYRRFSPGVLDALPHTTHPDFALGLQSLSRDSNTGQHWDEEIVKSERPFPKGLRLMMCDVDCGSQTVGMVRKILDWRKREQSDADEIWSNIQRANDTLRKQLYSQDRPIADEEIDRTALRTAIEDVRAWIRMMSAKANVPIEPTMQTRLIDALSQQPGVIGGLVPGAGGYDAVALLVEDRPGMSDQLARYLQDFSANNANISDYQPNAIRLLSVQQDTAGVQAEATSSYIAWL